MRSGTSPASKQITNESNESLKQLPVLSIVDNRLEYTPRAFLHETGDKEMESALAKFIDVHREPLAKTIIADELIDYFESLKGEDIEAVEIAQKNGGKIKGAKCLLDRLSRKASLGEFLQALQKAGYQQLLISLMDPRDLRREMNATGPCTDLGSHPDPMGCVGEWAEMRLVS